MNRDAVTAFFFFQKVVNVVWLSRVIIGAAKGAGDNRVSDAVESLVDPFFSSFEIFLQMSFTVGNVIFDLLLAFPVGIRKLRIILQFI